MGVARAKRFCSTGNLYQTPVEITLIVNTELDIEENIAKTASLYQNYPNPFKKL